MEKFTANDPETHSADIVAENVEHLKALFPEAFTEGRVDFGVLEQLLGLPAEASAQAGGAVDEREEKYGLNWHGKRRARQLALTPSTGTLRPCPQESVDWDTTQNLMIEGDNLEVLKLLQKSYSGKVKLIYIDPPYNTGKDFVYPDNYRDNIQNYLELTGQTDGENRKLSSNTETSGRFHTDWLNMMYPRLKLARNLMRDDGLICISIDDQEVANLRLLCDEIFGSENRVEEVVWKNKYGSGALTKGFANVHEYLLVYSRNPILNIAAPLDDEQRKAYKHKDSKFRVRGGFITQPLATTSKDDRPNLRYPILYKGVEIWPEKQWIWEKNRFDKAYQNDEIVINEKNGKYSVRVKQYLRDENGVERLGKPVSLLNGPFNQEGTKEVRELFGAPVFDFPKPSALIRYFFSVVINNEPEDDGLYLDFFAGSCPSAHAVLALNAADSGKRRFIMVQLPEACPPNSQASKSGLATIAEVGKDRIRRVRNQIIEQRKNGQDDLFSLDPENTEAGDLGFRVVKLDTSNIRAWEPDRDDLEGTLLDSIDHIKPDRSEEDILYEMLLKLGLDLCVPIETRTVERRKSIRSIGAGTLIACLDEQITREDVEPLARSIAEWHKELSPAGDSTVVFRDSAFVDDVAKTNLAAILEQHGLGNVRSI